MVGMGKGRDGRAFLGRLPHCSNFPNERLSAPRARETLLGMRPIVDAGSSSPSSYVRLWPEAEQGLYKLRPSIRSAA